MLSIESSLMQLCPVCGRSLRVPEQLLGQWVACGHCRGMFEARGRVEQVDLLTDPNTSFHASAGQDRTSIPAPQRRTVP